MSIAFSQCLANFRSFFVIGHILFVLWVADGVMNISIASEISNLFGEYIDRMHYILYLINNN